MEQNLTQTPELVAAIDLGSNSFHMVIAHLRKNELIIVDRIREMVRLAAGLNVSGSLNAEAQQRAVECLQRFGQRISGMPLDSIRAVGTNTLRIARNADEFTELAERALGYPIEVVSGMEEARLIYQGVSQSLASDGKRRLVMDIGGGSTEYIIGVDKVPMQKESLRMGCVSMSLKHFGDGKITLKRFKRAVIDAQSELAPFRRTFQNGNWNEAVGASGTLRAVEKLLVHYHWSKEGITPEGLNQLVEAVLSAGHQDKLQLHDLNPGRQPSIPGGLAILVATFKSLNIQHMKVSDGALREGLLYDLLGRINHEDVRARTVRALASRYHVDEEHSMRLRQTVQALLSQVGQAIPIKPQIAAQWLDWACDLHEIGLDIAHSHYHKHGAYVIENADLPGFSRQDQILLATLVKAHRRKFSLKGFKELISPWNQAAIPMALLLRLAVLLNRSRQTEPLPEIKIALNEKQIKLHFCKDWLNTQPLTEADLEKEAGYLAQAGIDLSYD